MKKTTTKTDPNDIITPREIKKLEILLQKHIDNPEKRKKILTDYISLFDTKNISNK
jgi:hypothetical protein